ncbi:hypothetical protein B0T18DRAFT_431497 [Schizothecium vesticola]|uniref:Uncharacterized protein n=1 Tax=Schizothecium vesticola TaxID=314040 RepID=A0AA40EFW6_9PEZI|nr:hypothetical protein B0T18DRAFT_431497 [Schizothecium vesticola]
MHLIACLVLALAAAVSAVPAPSDNAVANGLEIRQECLFECLCDSPDDEPVASTGTCCASVSGSLNNGRCQNLVTGQVATYRNCCTSQVNFRGSTCFAQNGCRVP